MSTVNMFVSAQNLRTNNIVVLRSNDLLDLNCRSRKGIRVKKCSPFRPQDKTNFKKKSPYGRLVAGKIHKYFILGMEATEELLSVQTFKNIQHNSCDEDIEDLDAYNYKEEDLQGMDGVAPMGGEEGLNPKIEDAGAMEVGASNGKSEDAINMDVGVSNPKPAVEMEVNSEKPEEALTTVVEALIGKSEDAFKMDEGVSNPKPAVEMIVNSEKPEEALTTVVEALIGESEDAIKMDVGVSNPKPAVEMEVKNAKPEEALTTKVKATDAKPEEATADVKSNSSRADLQHGMVDSNKHSIDGVLQLKPEFKVLLDRIDQMLSNVREEIIRNIHLASAGVTTQLPQFKTTDNTEPTKAASAVSSAEPTTGTGQVQKTYVAFEKNEKYEITEEVAFKILEDRISESQKMTNLTSAFLGGEEHIKRHALSAAMVKANPDLKFFSPKMSQVLADIYNDYSLTKVNEDETNKVVVVKLTVADINDKLKRVMHKCRKGT